MALAMSAKYTSPEKTQENFKKSEVGLEKNTIVKITQMNQINRYLQKGPVFVEIGAKWCPACRSTKPILEKLAAEYHGQAIIMSIDVDQSPELAEYFGVRSIPDCFVITGIEQGEYVYMHVDGKVSTDRSQARIVGRNVNNDEKVFEKIIDLALLQEGKSKSK
jgi:thiol-disulfide isomerase/thioredoxin